LVADALPESRGCLGDGLRGHGASVVEVADLGAATTALSGIPSFDAALVDEAFDPKPFVAPADPPAIIPLSAGGNGACRGAFADRWAELGLQAMAKPVRWSSLASAVAVAVGRVVAQPGPVDRRVPLTRSAEAEAAAGRFILVAEDNHTNRIVIAKQLDYLGLAFDIVEDGEAAWAALTRKSYALLLTDCRMPNLDGYALASRIRETEMGDGKRLPIVALTANALSDDSDKCFAAGMDDYLAKPVTLEGLETTLCRWLPALCAATTNKSPAAPESQRPTKFAKSPSSSAPAIDCAALADLLGDDSPETFALIFSSFMEFFPGLLEMAQAAIDRRDRNALHDAAHAAKGAARSACADVLAAIMVDLEKKALGRTGFPRLGQILETAQGAYEEIVAFIADWNAGRQGEPE
jgi:CheY-like chemotaxis protein